MSNGFNVGGAPMQLVRALGTSGAIQGFRTAEPTQGPRLAAALATTFRHLGQAGAVQLALAAAFAQFYVRKSPAFKLLTFYVWKSGAFKLLTLRVWKSGAFK